MTSYRCEGKCGRVVSSDGAYCFVCWSDAPHSIDGILGKIVNAAPNRRTPEGESLRMRLDILNAAYHFALGPEPLRKGALEKLMFLGNVAQHEQEHNKEQK